jgi:hypothetical protein
LLLDYWDTFTGKAQTSNPVPYFCIEGGIRSANIDGNPLEGLDRTLSGFAVFAMEGRNFDDS